MQRVPSHRAHHKRRGTASVEVVMMLPFFIIIYAGIYYMHGRYAGRQLALTKARACAWSYSQRGCTGDRPPECELIPSDEGDMGPIREAAGDTAADILETIHDIPVVGPIVLTPITMLFGRPLVTHASQDVNLPEPAIGPTSFRVYGAGRDGENHRRPSYYTLCNTERQGWRDVAHNIFCEFVGLATDSFPTCP